MSEYTPTTEEIRDYVGEGGEPRPWIAPDDDAEKEAARLAAFDRWLRTERANAWDAGVAMALEAANETTDSFGNLYRLDWLDRVAYYRAANPHKEDV